MRRSRLRFFPIARTAKVGEKEARLRAQEGTRLVIHDNVSLPPSLCSRRLTQIRCDSQAELLFLKLQRILRVFLATFHLY